MSYINEKLGKNDKEKVKEFLLSEGFIVHRKIVPYELTYSAKGVELTALITVNIERKTIHSYLDSNFGMGRVDSVFLYYTYENFEETYKNFIDEISDRIR